MCGKKKKDFTLLHVPLKVVMVTCETWSPKIGSKFNKLTSIFYVSVLLLIIVNNKTDALKTDINLFVMITDCRISRSHSLTHRVNFKFMCLSAY